VSLTVWSLTADILRAPEMEIEMTWQYQVRFDLKDAATAGSARRDLRHPLLAPLADILASVYWDCQYHSFEDCYRRGILAGNIGFCNPSPYYVAGSAEHRQPQKRRARNKTGASPALNRRAAAAFFAGSPFCFRDLYMWADRLCANVGRAGGFR